MFLEYANIKAKILKLRVTPTNDNDRPILPSILNVVQMGGKGCQNIYNSIQKKSDNTIQNLNNKWECMLNEDISVEDIQKGFKITQTLPNWVYNRYVQLRYCMID